MIYITVTTLFILTFICILVLLKSTFLTQTSIQLNINSNSESVSNFHIVTPKYNVSANQKNKTRKYHIPKFMLELYEKNKANRNNLTGADVVRSLIPKQADAINDNDIIEESEDHLLIFDLPNSDEEEEFVSAELRILTLIEAHSYFSRVQRQVKISTFDENQVLRNLEEIYIYHLNNTWLSFNVTKEVRKILNKPGSDRHLKIVISVREFFPRYKNNFKLSLMPVRDDLEHDYPILLLSYTSKKKKKPIRKKRSIEEDYEEETNRIWDNTKKPKRNNCRRKPLYINFSEINFDEWIVQPRGYEAYQCQGKCFYPVAEHLNPTKHAIVQALLHSVSPSKVSRSCCVPTRLDSISILYVDNHGVLTYRYAYKDMVVLECGCR